MNPFSLKPYEGPELFCDRQRETKHLIGAIKNKRNITLHSIRRLGKTGLIMHVQQQLPKKYIPVYVDIYDTIDDHTFVSKVISATIAAIDQRKNILKRALRLFARFKATITIDPILGTPTVTLDIKETNQAKQSLQVLWNIIREDKKHIYQIAIDEFQQITEYPKSTIDATLREAIQTIPNIHFIFSGSQKHLLTGLFIDIKKPLFRSTESIELHPIPFLSYQVFIKHQYTKYKKKISSDIIDHILLWNKQHTYYVHYFCHLLFEKSSKTINEENIEQIKQHIFIENEMMYYQIKKLLTKHQWTLLSAIANEDILRSPNANHLRIKYKLGASSTVTRSLNALLNKELVFSQFDNKGTSEYQVYDVYLSKWIVYKGI